MRILALNGKAGAGKDTFADRFIEYQAGCNILSREFLHKGNWMRVAFADPIREGIEAMFKIPRADMLNSKVKNEPDYKFGRSIRYMAQTLGTEWGRDLIHPDVWLLVAHEKIQKAEKAGFDGVIITDCRFENEVDFFHSIGGEVIQIVRPDNSHTDSVSSNGATNHVSEAGIPQDKIDFVLVNDKKPEDMIQKWKEWHSTRSMDRLDSAMKGNGWSSTPIAV